jgi:hypothetical protein
VERDLEKVTSGGVQAKEAEVNAAKKKALVKDLVASVCARVVAKRHHMSAVFHVPRCAAPSVVPL